jgi:hypothetical protein
MYNVGVTSQLPIPSSGVFTQGFQQACTEIKSDTLEAEPPEYRHRVVGN